MPELHSFPFSLSGVSEQFPAASPRNRLRPPKGTPSIFFSPDSRLVYASNTSDVGIYALQSSTGKLGANTTLPDTGNVSIATATLH